MNCKICALAVAGFFGLTASADVLYWQVNDTAAAGTGLNGTPAQAYLMATAENNASSPFYVSSNLDAAGNELGDGVGVGTFGNGGQAAGVLDLAKILSWSDDTSASAAGISSLSALSFFVELYDAAGNWVGKTDAQSYDSLVASGAVSSGLNPNFSGVNNALGGSGSTFTNVPEPTSGLLMLVGLGALALRRRKVS